MEQSPPSFGILHFVNSMVFTIQHGARPLLLLIFWDCHMSYDSNYHKVTFVMSNGPVSCGVKMVCCLTVQILSSLMPKHPMQSWQKLFLIKIKNFKKVPNQGEELNFPCHQQSLSEHWLAGAIEWGNIYWIVLTWVGPPDSPWWSACCQPERQGGRGRHHFLFFVIKVLWLEKMLQYTHLRTLLENLTDDAIA